MSDKVSKKVVAIGATGTIGRAVADALEAACHEVVRASRRVEPKVDQDDKASLAAFVERHLAGVDAIVTTAGSGRMRGPWSRPTRTLSTPCAAS